MWLQEQKGGKESGIGQKLRIYCHYNVEHREDFMKDEVLELRLQNQIKSNLSLYSLYYTEACNQFAGLIFASLRPGNTAPFEEMPQQWRVIGNTAFDLTDPRLEPQTRRFREKCVTNRTTDRLHLL